MMPLTRSVSRNPTFIYFKHLNKGAKQSVNFVTSKGSNCSLDMVSVVAFDAAEMLAKEERWASDEDDSSEGKHSEHTVPDCTFLFEEDPSQQ